MGAVVTIGPKSSAIAGIVGFYLDRNYICLAVDPPCSHHSVGWHRIIVHDRDKQVGRNYCKSVP
jgi:hypothetical protein